MRSIEVICSSSKRTARSVRGGISAASTWWCGPRPRLGWVEMAVGHPEDPSYPGYSPPFFRRAAL